jgi:hypothetical protein
MHEGYCYIICANRRYGKGCFDTPCQQLKCVDLHVGLTAYSGKQHRYNGNVLVLWSTTATV